MITEIKGRFVCRHNPILISQARQEIRKRWDAERNVTTPEEEEDEADDNSIPISPVGVARSNLDWRNFRLQSC